MRAPPAGMTLTEGTPVFNICAPCEAPSSKACSYQATGAGVGGAVLMVLVIAAVRWIQGRRVGAEDAAAASSAAPSSASSTPSRPRPRRRHHHHGHGQLGAPPPPPPPPPPQLPLEEQVLDAFSDGYGIGEDVATSCVVM